MADFVIAKSVPFVVEGVDGAKYELPRVQKFSVEQIKLLGECAKAKERDEQADAAKRLILALCPELENEPVGDAEYLSLSTELIKKSDMSMGES